MLCKPSKNGNTYRSIESEVERIFKWYATQAPVLHFLYADWHTNKKSVIKNLLILYLKLMRAIHYFLMFHIIMNGFVFSPLTVINNASWELPSSSFSSLSLQSNLSEIILPLNVSPRAVFRLITVYSWRLYREKSLWYIYASKVILSGTSYRAGKRSDDTVASVLRSRISQFSSNPSWLALQVVHLKPALLCCSPW